jgi:hypothetical protein
LDAIDCRVVAALVFLESMGAIKNGDRICPRTTDRLPTKKSKRRYTVISVTSTTAIMHATHFAGTKKATIEYFQARPWK